jgi:uncharacterized damage-inducible protein DinB
MQLTEHLCLMADYNQWMNTKVYEAAATLSAEELAKNRGAFFGSIIGTLNHIVVADTIWLQRFAPVLQTHQELNVIRELNPPQSLDEIVFSSLEELYERRKMLDNSLSQLAKAMTQTELNQAVSYTNTKGIDSTKNLFSLLMHVFNHQTHHRGQVTTLLSQAGVDVGVTDLVAIIPNTACVGLNS